MDERLRPDRFTRRSQDGGARGLVAGLECRVGKAPIAVPVDSIAQIIEYDTVPLPLARRWIAGVGLHAERLVLTVALVSDRPGPDDRPHSGPHRTRGVLLRLPDTEIAWTLEVQEVLRLVRARVESGRPSADSRELPPWIARASTEDGRAIGWIDVPAMLAELTSAVRAEP
jgi:chemotaxis signal transduction protein